MQNTASLSFLNSAEKITLLAYQTPREHSIIISEVVSRIAAALLLSAAAAADIAVHTFFILPTFVYSIGKSIYQWDADFNIPWQHIQRIRNAVAPLLLGSIAGLIHPLAGLAICEPTDKHIALGMLSSHTHQNFDTPCSPVHSLSLVEDLAKELRYAKLDGTKKEIFPLEHLKAIAEAKKFEKSLESLQAQDYIHKIANITLLAMTQITNSIEYSNLSRAGKELLTRASGLLVPVLTAIDVSITLIAQTFFLAIGIVQILSGRGPIYTEVTNNPLMHVSFLIQNVLKSLGNLIGTCIWLISPAAGFRASLLPSHLFFGMQMSLLMLTIKMKMTFSKESDWIVIPIAFQNSYSTISLPFQNMHKTYLVVEKKDGLFNLYWINRPTISLKQGVDLQTASSQIESMLKKRFPSMDIETLMNSHEPQPPEFPSSVQFAKIEDQGNDSNCVVSNLFGTFEAFDKIRGADLETTRLRYKATREYLMALSSSKCNH